MTLVSKKASNQSRERWDPDFDFVFSIGLIIPVFGFSGKNHRGKTFLLSILLFFVEKFNKHSEIQKKKAQANFFVIVFLIKFKKYIF